MKDPTPVEALCRPDTQVLADLEWIMSEPISPTPSVHDEFSRRSAAVDMAKELILGERRAIAARQAERYWDYEDVEAWKWGWLRSLPGPAQTALVRRVLRRCCGGGNLRALAHPSLNLAPEALFPGGDTPLWRDIPGIRYQYNPHDSANEKREGKRVLAYYSAPNDQITMPSLVRAAGTDPAWTFMRLCDGKVIGIDGLLQHELAHRDQRPWLLERGTAPNNLMGGVVSLLVAHAAWTVFPSPWTWWLAAATFAMISWHDGSRARNPSRHGDFEAHATIEGWLLDFDGGEEFGEVVARCGERLKFERFHSGRLSRLTKKLSCDLACMVALRATGSSPAEVADILSEPEMGARRGLRRAMVAERFGGGVGVDVVSRRITSIVEIWRQAFPKYVALAAREEAWRGYEDENATT